MGNRGKMITNFERNKFVFLYSLLVPSLEYGEVIHSAYAATRDENPRGLVGVHGNSSGLLEFPLFP